MSRGSLRIYLGAAPGVGKTFAMLNEGARRSSRGTDVVVGYVETHNRPQTKAQLEGLEVLPRITRSHRGSDFPEMDLDGLLARHPAVALVDELAHTNIPGGANEKRWQDVEQLLDAGIDVISTVNIQHLESLNDVVERITGIAQNETVPDGVVRGANQLELVDMAPAALQRRMAHGNVYAAEKVDAALANYFRIGNLTALRELALLWVADQVEDSLHDYMASHGITEAWETRERVVVAITGGPTGEHLIRRASRMATRTRGDLLGVHIRSDDGLSSVPTGLLEKHRKLLEDVGGTYHEVVGRDVATALAQFARAESATQVVLGATGRSLMGQLTGGSVVNQVLRQLQGIDVHVIGGSTDGGGAIPSRPRHHAPLSMRRRVLGWATAVLGVPLLTLLLAQFRGELGLPSDLLLYLVLVIAAASIGGFGPAVLAAVTGSLALNYYFTPPLYTFTVSEGENTLGLAVFLLVGVTLSLLVTKVSRQSLDAHRAQAEAEALTRLATGLVADEDPVPGLLDRLRTTFDLDRVALQVSSSQGWRTEQQAIRGLGLTAASDAAVEPVGNATALPVDPGTRLLLEGRALTGDDQRILLAFTAHLGAALERQALQRDAAHAAAVTEGDALRTSLLRSVSHDLRTPLASIKASVTSLLQRDVDFPEEVTDDFLETIDHEADRLNRLVGNLLDMSRLESGAVAVHRRRVGLEEVVSGAISSLSMPTSALEVNVPETLPSLEVDQALLERAIANVVSNALRHAPPGTPVRIEAGYVSGRIDLRVIDQGPGVAAAERERMFHPFQRLGDDHHTGNLGLGLAVAKGFVEVLGGELELEDTPGGGATMVIRLQVGP